MAEIGDFIEATVTLVVSPAPEPPPDPEGRFLISFDSATLDPDPVWTRVDDYPNLVTSYSIDRGRAYELDRTDTGRATVAIADPDGILSPLNPDSPFWDSGTGTTKIRPLLQAALGRRNPVTDEWSLRYRGFIEDLAYSFDPSQQVNRLTVTLVDLFDVLSAAEMQPGEFGDYPGAGNEGQVWYPAAQTDLRIQRILTDFGLSRRFWATLPAATSVNPVTYSAGESPLAAVQEAADADFPSVANVFCDRRGRLVTHGRLSKFYPAATAASVGPGLWDFHEWTVGDGAAVDDDPDNVVQLRGFGYVRGLSKMINAASATPVDLADELVAGQLVVDAWSVGLYGLRSWSAPSLLTAGSLVDDADALTECHRFAQYIVANYKWPHDRVTDLVLRPLDPSDVRAPALWAMLNAVDIGDLISVNIQSPGGGGYDPALAKWFVEGIHEQVRPLTPDYDDVTMTFDLSPAALFEENPWADVDTPALEAVLAA